MNAPETITPSDLVQKAYQLPFAPYEFQAEGVDLTAPLSRSGQYIEPGLGKTSVSTLCALYKMTVFGTDLTVVVMPPILISNWCRYLRSIKRSDGTPLNVLAYRGTPAQRKSMTFDGVDFVCMSMQIFKRDIERIESLCAKRNVHVIVDECFPAGTLVSTEDGEVPIENVKVGDAVLTSAGFKHVTSAGRRTVFETTIMELENGNTIECTPDHPFFTDIGWLPSALCQGRRVFDSASLSDMRQGIQSGQGETCTVTQVANTHRADLLAILRSEEVSHPQPGEEGWEETVSRIGARTSGSRKGCFAEAGDEGCRVCENDRVIFGIGSAPANIHQTGGLLNSSLLPDMRERVHRPKGEVALIAQEQQAGGSDVFATVCAKTRVFAESRQEQEGYCRDARCGAGDPKGVHTERGICRKDEGHSDCERSQTKCSGREWHGDDAHGSVDCAVAGKSWVRVELPCYIGQEARRLSYVLQARFRESRSSGWSGDRRQIAQDENPQGAGSQEGTETVGIRVARVSRREHACGVDVFNITVAECPNYFAGNVLVHNCTSVKNVSSQNYRTLSSFVSDRSLQLLTGTPLNKPGDGYAYIKLISPTVYRTLYQFENIHVESRDFFGNVTKWRNLDLLKENLLLNSYRKIKEEVLLDLPPAVLNPIYYDLDPAHAKLYKRLAEEQLLRFEDGTKLDATNISALTHALGQIVCNWDHFSQDESNLSAIYDLIDETLEEIGDAKLVVFTHYRLTSKKLADHYKAPAVWGEVTPAQKEAALQKFIEDSSCRLIILNQVSAGLGIDGLQHVCSDCLFTEVPGTSALFEQAYSRLYRDGQKKSVNVRIAAANGTLQIRTLKAVSLKQDLVNSIQGGLSNLRAAVFGD